MPPTPVRIAMWSGPRNISTALMRAWENRGDCAVSDEPLYAHYLAEHGVGVFEVQTPLMDLSDAQVAEMALDLDVPIWRTWWWEAAMGKRAKDPALADRANACRDRWCGALEALGWSASAEAAAAR